MDENFFIASFLKGSKDVEINDDYCQNKLSDVANAWNVFDIYQVYSRFFPITSELVDRFFDPEINPVKDSCLGKGLCESSLAFTPCSPANRFRIIKLGSIKHISSLSLRAAPIAMLQRFGLIDQALPLANFYFKVRLRNDVDDSLFQTKIIETLKNPFFILILMV